MGRPRLKVKKYTVMLNDAELFTAQLYATRDGVNPKITGNNSAFLRWLLQTYIKEFET